MKSKISLILTSLLISLAVVITMSSCDSPGAKLKSLNSQLASTDSSAQENDTEQDNDSVSDDPDSPQDDDNDSIAPTDIDKTTAPGELPQKPEVVVADIECSRCKGKGESDCPICNSTGQVNGYFCYTCNGTGIAQCSFCNGQGTIPTKCIRSDKAESGYKAVDLKWFDNIWAHYINSGLWDSSVPDSYTDFEDYYDYIYGQAVAIEVYGKTLQGRLTIDYGKPDYNAQTTPDSGIYDTDNSYGHSTNETQCFKCGGSGKIVCTECGGSGKIERQKEAISFDGSPNYYTIQERCPRCDGDKYISCNVCHGQGHY